MVDQSPVEVRGRIRIIILIDIIVQGLGVSGVIMSNFQTDWDRAGAERESDLEKISQIMRLFCNLSINGKRRMTNIFRDLIEGWNNDANEQNEKRAI